MYPFTLKSRFLEFPITIEPSHSLLTIRYYELFDSILYPIVTIVFNKNFCNKFKTLFVDNALFPFFDCMPCRSVVTGSIAYLKNCE